MSTMSVSEAVRTRRSIRGFRPEPIPDALLRDILGVARYAPSNCNTQPWHVTVVSGAMRQTLEAAILSELVAGKAATPDFQLGDSNLTGVYRERQIECAVRLYGTMGIERQDKLERTNLMKKNWEFFGAPHVAFLSMPVAMGPVNAVDVGIYLQTFMLLLVEHGLASVPQGSLAAYPDQIKKLIGLPEGHGILCGLSFGYEDVDARINQAIMDRAPLADTVTFVS